MNQKVIIYIILSAILLYLYYKRGNLAIFAAFVVVVAGTLIFRGHNDELEGLEMGGGGGDKECAKMGFTPIKLDKDDLPGSLEKVYNSIKKIADKHWPYDGMGGNKGGDKEKDEERKKKNAELETIMEVWTKEAEAELGDKKKKSDQVNAFVTGSTNMYEKKGYKELAAEKPENIKKMISGGELTLKIIEKVSKSSKIESGSKNTLKYLNCLCKYWISIYKELQKAKGGDGGGDGGGDDEEDKPKKNTKKTKKASEDDEDADADAEEKPKKKTTKKKSKKADDDEE